jgi:hypothetical protein
VPRFSGLLKLARLEFKDFIYCSLHAEQASQKLAFSAILDFRFHP